MECKSRSTAKIASLFQIHSSISVLSIVSCGIDGLAGFGVGERAWVVRPRPARSEAGFVEQGRRQRGGEIDRQDLRLTEIAALEIKWPSTNPVIVGPFKTPACADLLPRVEAVIDLQVDLLANIGCAEGIPVGAAPLGLQPPGPSRVQAVAGFIVVYRRHHAEHLFHISARIHLGPIGIPGRALNDRV